MRKSIPSFPLAPVAVGLVIGVVLREFGRLPLPIAISVLVLSTGIALKSAWRTRWGIQAAFLAAIAVGAVLHARSTNVAANDIARWAQSQRRLARLRGRVVSMPTLRPPPDHPFAPWTYGGERTVFWLQADSMETEAGFAPVTGRVGVSVGEPVLDLVENDRVEVFGWLGDIPPPHNPGAYDWSAHYRRRGIVAWMHCQHRENVKLLNATPDERPSIRNRLRSTVRRILMPVEAPPEETGGLLEAMILGQRSQISRRLNEAFIRAGCAHFLAVSGLHLAIPMVFVWWLGGLVGLGGKTRAWLMMATVIGYALIAEPRPPILRAAVLGVLFCSSKIIGRRANTVNWLSAAAIVLIAASPLTVLDVGFQLSFAAVLGIVYLPGALRGCAAQSRTLVEQRLLDIPCGDSDRALRAAVAQARGGLASVRRNVMRALRLYVIFPFLMSIGAWIATMPILAFYFYRVYPWSPLATLLISPLVFALVMCGFFKIVIETIMPGYGAVLSAPLSWLSHVLIRFVEALGSWPGASWMVSAPRWWWIVAWYVFWIAIAYCFKPVPKIRDTRTGRTGVAQTEPKRTGAGVWTTIVIALLVMLYVVVPHATPRRLAMTVLSVGAGSATVLELPGGKTILYDAGGSAPYDVGRSAVVPFLQSRGIRKIDRVYISHPNLDHFSGLPTIIQAFDTGPVLVNAYFKPRSVPRSPSRRLQELLARYHHPLRTMPSMQRRWSFGEVSFEWLWPDALLDDTFSTNETSTVLRIGYAGRTILLTGDIENRAQRALLDRDIRADVLVLPHHGSVRASSWPFLEAVDPAVVVRSSGEPQSRTLSDLSSVVGSAKLLNTADVGAITVVFDQDGMEVRTQHGGRWSWKNHY